MLDEFFDEQREKFLDFIGDATSIFVIYHSDPDGVCSAAMMKLWLKENDRRVYITSTKFGLVDIDDEIAKHVMSFDKIIILDLSSKNRMLRKKKDDICRIDHHIIDDLYDEKLLINPRILDENIYLPTSYIVWRLFQRRKDYSFIAHFGSKLDKCEKCDDLYALALSKYPEINNVFNEMSEILNVSRYIKSANIVANMLISLYRSGSPKYLKATSEYSKLSRLKHLINNEISKHVSHPQKVFHDKKISVIRVCSSFSVHTSVASLYSKFMKEKVVVVYNPCISKEHVYFEVRSKEDLYDVFKKELFKYVESFGGHENAFGFKVSKEKMSEVLDLIKNITF